jgi:excisionase family DNA binding protein
MIFDDRSLVSVTEILKYVQSDRFMSKREAAEYCGVSIRTIESWQGLPRYKPSGKTLFRKSELDAFIERYREQSADVDLARIADDAVASILK